MPAPQSPLLALAHDALLPAVRLTSGTLLPVAAGTAEVAAWSPNGQFLAVGDASGSLRLWDPAQRRLTASIWRPHRRFLNALAWSPNGHLLLSAAADGSVRLWQVSPRGILAPLWSVHLGTQLPHVPAVAFSPRGGRLAIADGEHTVTLWRLAARPGAGRQPAAPWLQGRLSIPGHSSALMWSPNGACLAVGTLEGRILLWRAPGATRPVTRALGSPIYALAWAPAGDTLAVGGADGIVRLLAGTDLRLRALLLAPFRQTPVLHASDYGRSIPGHTAGTPQLLAGAAINSLAWSPGGDILAVTATGVPLRLWQPVRGAVIATYQDNWDLNTVAWRADGGMVAVAADDGRVRILHVVEPVAELRQGLCRLDVGPWCMPLLGRRTGTALVPAAPPSYMSR